MEVVSGYYSCAGDGKMKTTSMEVEDAGGGDGLVFDLFSLRAELPKKRKGLSLYFSGKSRSFSRLNEAKSIGDLEKLEIPEAKRRKHGLSRCGGSCLGLTAALADK